MDRSERQGLANQAVALSAAIALIQAELDNVRARLDAELAPGERLPAMLGDERLGYVIKDAPKAKFSAQVVDLHSLTDWVQERYPEQVYATVRPAFITAILASSTKAGEPMSPDGEADVPGVWVGRGVPPSRLSVRPEHEAVIEALRSRRMSLDPTGLLPE